MLHALHPVPKPCTPLFLQPDPDRRVPPYHDLELVQELSRMMRASQRAAARAPRVAEESRKWLQWDEYMGLVRALKTECAGEVVWVLPLLPSSGLVFT